MASHHCHLHHHQLPSPTPPYCCNTSCCRPQAPPPDPHLETILARLLQSPPPPYGHFPRHRRSLERIHQPSVLSSLLDRIEALESSLHSVSISPPSSSLRDAAARVIQTHVRLFLARRSRTLRHLKELASIKSKFTALRSSLSNGSRLNLASLSERAMDLLLKLDSIQDNDPMIRDGKRSITRDLDAFLEYIDTIAVKRHYLSLSSRKTVKSLPNSSKSRILREEREMVNNLRNRVERTHGLSKVFDNDEEDVELESFDNFSDDGEDNKIEYLSKGCRGQPQPRVKKNVTFAENGNVYRIIITKPNLSSSSEDGSCVDGSVSGDNQVEVSEKLKGLGSGSYVGKGYEEEEAELENNVASPASSDGGVPSSWLRNEPKINIVRESPDQGVEFMFSSPLPDKVGIRGDLMKRRKALMIAAQ